jgi:hypothetical protein
MILTIPALQGTHSYLHLSRRETGRVFPLKSKLL